MCKSAMIAPDIRAFLKETVMSNAVSRPISEASAKSQARNLKTFLDKKGISLNHSACLEAVAFQLGFKSWNHLSGSFSSASDSEANTPISALVTIDDINQVIKKALATNEEYLKRTLASFLPSHLEVFTEVDCGQSYQGDSPENSYWVTHDAKAFHDKDTEMVLGLYSNYEIIGLNSISLSTHIVISIKREGYGPRDLNGNRKDMLEFFELSHSEDVIVDLISPSWKEAIGKSISSIDKDGAILSIVQSRKMTLESFKAELSKKRLPGLTNRNLYFGD